MPRDIERLERLQSAMKEAGFDAIACSLPTNVLLATGYFPVVGTSLAIVTRDCETILFAPEDEIGLVDCGAANEIIPYRPGSLDSITNAVEAIREPIAKTLREKHLDRAVIGYEWGPAFEPASYASMHLFSGGILELFADASLRPASHLLARMKAVLTPIEADRVKRACRIACIAYERGAEMMAAGLKESEAAAHFRSPLATVGIGFEGVDRADGHVFCMSGEHSGQAYGAYARSRAKRIEITDLVLTHCNSHADGYWTDITRTYCIGPLSDRQFAMYEAVFEAGQAALSAIRPGAKAAAVDLAVRDVLRSRGFGDRFKHGTGHGVGFAAIDHNARPRIHPKSDETLERGMVFNVEPAIYFEDFGGVRHCDMVAVTADGAEVLTPFQSRIEDLVTHI